MVNPIDTLIERSRAKRLKIAVVGDAMTDVYVHGHFDTCQEECYKFVEDRRVECPGGAANAQGSLEHWNVLTNGLFQRGDIPVKTRFIVNGKFVFRHDLEQDEKNTCFDADREIALNSLREHPDDAILISDYDKGFLTPEFIRQVIDLSVERGVPVVADAKREPEFYQGAILKCNWEYLFKFSDHNAEPIGFTGDYVCTHGADDPSVNGNTPEWFRLYNTDPNLPDRSMPDVVCVSHVGAGDCFAAHLVLALAHGMSLQDATAIAHSAGRIYVQYHHNRPPYPFEIRKDIDPAGGKVLTGLKELRALRQSTAGRLVFAPGVFRLIHAGHAEMLRWARVQGDALVVGVNSDESAARLKPGEFCLPLRERVAVLAAMEYVDWIVAFDGDQPRGEVEALEPDVMVKGPDYAGKSVCCADLVKDVRIAPAGEFAGVSASEMAGRIGR